MKKRNLFKILGVSALCCAAGFGAYSAIKADYEPKQANAVDYYQYYDCNMYSQTYYNRGASNPSLDAYNDNGVGIEGGPYMGNGFTLPIGTYGGWYTPHNMFLGSTGQYSIDRIYFAYTCSDFYNPADTTEFLYHKLEIKEISFRITDTDNSWLIGYMYTGFNTGGDYNRYQFYLDSWEFGNVAGVNEIIPNAWFNFLFEVNFIDYSPSSYSNFTFGDVFNYNGPYERDIDSVLINEPSFDSSNYGQSVYKTYQFSEGFWSSGKWFDSIRLTYTNAYNVSFYYEGEVRTGTTGQGYWAYMYYGYEGSWTLVASRKFKQTTSQLNEYTAVDVGVLWVNNSYKSLQLHSPSLTEVDYLAQFNSNYTGSYNGFSGGDSSGSLVNVFSLFATAFSSWADILSIQIIPGITIGFMMFLPLISGIIILIIWIVKR